MLHGSAPIRERLIPTVAEAQQGGLRSCVVARAHRRRFRGREDNRGSVYRQRTPLELRTHSDAGAGHRRRAEEEIPGIEAPELEPAQDVAVDALQEELSRTEEELVNARQENTYLTERIKELEAENAKLKRMYADKAMETEALRDLIEKKL